jgi:AcrR family transcriptional regulator
MNPSSVDRATPARRRNSGATKDAIERAARALFVRWGYDGARLRDIAGRATVDKRLVGRYFGSKADLFAEVLRHTTDSQPMVPPITQDAAADLLTRPRAEGYLDGYLMTIRSTSNAEALEILRTVIERYGEQPLAELLTGPHREGRAALLIAVNMGVLLMRDIIGTTALTNDETNELIPYLDAVFRALTNPPSPGLVDG